MKIFTRFFLSAFFSLFAVHLNGASYSWSGPTSIPDLYPAEGTLTAVVTRISPTQFTLTVSGNVTKNGSPEKGRVDVVQAANPTYGPSIEVSASGVGGTATRDVISPTFTLNFYFVGGSTYLVKTISDIPFPPAGDPPQTVTISPTSINPLKTGQSATFTASGGNTSYSWIATGNPEILGSGSTRTMRWTEEGVWTVSVYAVAGTGWAKSNTAEASVFVAKEITVRIPVKNGNPVGSGVLVAGIGKKNGIANNDWTTGVLQPQQTDTVVIDGVKTGDVVTVDIVRVGVKKDFDGNLIPGNSDYTAGPVDYLLIKTDTIDHTTTYSGELQAGETASTVNVVKGAPTDNEKSVWTPTDSTAPTTDAIYKQGTDKIVSSLEAANKILREINAKTVAGGTGGTGGTGGSASDTGTHTRLDTVNQNLEKMLGDPDAATTAAAAAAAQGAAAGGNVAAALASGASTGAGLLATPMLSGASGLTASPIPGDNGYARLPKVMSTSGNSVMAGAFGSQLDLNPFSSAAMDRLTGGNSGVFLAWIRNFIAWATILGFVKWTLDKVNETCGRVGIITPLQLSPSAQIVVQTSVVGNSVGVPLAGGLWAVQILVITTAILAAPAVIVGAIYTAGEFSVLFPASTSAATAAASGGGGWLANILSYSYICLPVPVMIAVTINSLIIRVTNIAQTVVVSVGLKLASGI